MIKPSNVIVAIPPSVPTTINGGPPSVRLTNLGCIVAPEPGNPLPNFHKIESSPESSA